MASITNNRSYNNLHRLDGFTCPVYFSEGAEQKARETALRCERAWDFLNNTFNLTAKITVVVLFPEHWPEYAAHPLYGMPHILDTHTLIIAGQNNEMWRNLLPPLEMLPSSIVASIHATYQQPNGEVNLSPFFDLLAVHEMGHLYHYQMGRLFPRTWLMELFCNLCLHAYVDTQEPEQLPALETMPRLMVGMEYAHLTYQTLADFEQLYADMPPPNFAWFQGRLHVAAKLIYDVGGIETLQRLWDLPLVLDKTVTDEHLAKYLETHIHPEVAWVLTAWPNL